jgi:hypothetical protein
LKKDGKPRLVQDLGPLNAVTIRHTGLPPSPEPYSEWFAGHSIYCAADIYIGYDEMELHIDFRDLTTFAAPQGNLRLTTVPMGWSNAVTIYHGAVGFLVILEAKTTKSLFDKSANLRSPYVILRFQSDEM